MYSPRSPDRPHLLADISRIQEKAGWSPRYTIQECLKETLVAEGLLPG